MNPEQIESFLKANPEISMAKVNGDGRHFDLTIVSTQFCELSKLKRQLWVYGLLKDLIISGQMHAVQLHTWTEEEWEKQSG